MVVRLCGLLHELLNCGGKVHIKKFVRFLPARRNVMRARLCRSRINNCEGPFVNTVVIITCLIFCMFIVWNNNLCLSDISVLIRWGWKDSCTNIPHGDLRFGARRPRRLVALFVGVRTCGLPPSAPSLLGNFDPAGSAAIQMSTTKRPNTYPMCAEVASYLLGPGPSPWVKWLVREGKKHNV
jgi:hypothetical protein